MENVNHLPDTSVPVPTEGGFSDPSLRHTLFSSSSSEAKDLKRVCLHSRMTENRPTPKLLIDTDIADAPDDAFAIYMAMRMDAEIVGITTVFRDTKKRAETVRELLSAYGEGYESVPVVAGAGDAETDDAADFIIDACKKYGKELTVVAIGPFTNIARAIKKDAAALGLADKIVIMGGAYFKQYADWNVMCDAESAAVMFDALDNLECIGADVTHMLDIGDKRADIIASHANDSDARGLISRLYAEWRAENPNDNTVLHDPLAVYYALHPEACTVKAAHVAVITEGLGRGMTLNADAYRKAYMNPAFDGRDTERRVLVADGVDA
ncbi:MAG: nucleoside hydrolase, partial [Clostridia bacterium]|nr:nucleoside hydrolase [Clostridia bacterium]